MSDKVNNKKLSKKELVKSWFLWLTFCQSTYSYERMQAPGFAHSMAPIINKLYDKKEDRASALQRHLVFFNTQPTIGSIIPGITAAMEEEKANGAPVSDEAINAIKTGLMGPLAGIGDTLIQGAVVPILLAICIGISREGNVLGPVLYSILVSAVVMGVSYILYMQGYRFGSNAVENLLQSGTFNKVIMAAGVLGCTVIGALTAQYVSLSTPITMTFGESKIALQADIIDKVFPGLLPLLLTFGVYKLLQKGVSPARIMLIIIVAGVVGSLIGIF
ncbi:PTS system mannose/fructose/sorbose family transporter subunit IID [Tepidimicrobium xylanilyticum]|uniref:PTS system, mannose-specific IID component n=1 Tax=Tepidimicrobium xylanilyticum TaxID=1123352 RepID=A0A1H2RD97_9FIRM|nr:PTS system mannose/fructose/sorbose family transporter subunit IID [Tepidimicrobium xylanilyticum]GMG95455.1 PTS N-acetylglucosamine transporter subunit IIABC [Tepidimicrobium xylanilyticum]SDW17446.1 PTS system, mannose-specific IID component [Tepidimicrobium xylanilyticum]